MDSAKIIIPTIICFAIAVIFYSKLKKSSKHIEDDKSKKEEKKENENELKNKNEEKNDELEEEVEEEEEVEDEKEKEKKKKVMSYNILFDKFCDYIQKNKLVSVEAISQKLNTTKEETIKFFRELENEGKMVGYLGKDGEYFYLSMKELELLNNLLLKTKNQEINEEELEKQFQDIVKQGEKSII